MPDTAWLDWATVIVLSFYMFKCIGGLFKLRECDYLLEVAPLIMLPL